MFPGEDIINIKELTPGYEDHASDVWLVETGKRRVIVRTSGIRDLAYAGPFFKGLNILFGIDPTNVFSLEAINHGLSALDAFVYPKVLGKHQMDREYVVVEPLRGSTLESFTDLPDNELVRFGANLAKIHGHKLDYWGNPSGTFRIDMDRVNGHMINSMRQIVKEFHMGDEKIVGYLPRMEQILNGLTAPEHTSFVLVDIDPTQFLAANGIITGLVDTEAYVIAPRELDFIALEYVLDKRSAELITEGYGAVLPIPDLRNVRTVYRYLYGLIGIQDFSDIDDWLSQPSLF